MHTKKNCRLLFLATSRTGCLATGQQNSDRNVSYKDNSYNMYVMSIKITSHQGKNTKQRMGNNGIVIL